MGQSPGDSLVVAAFAKAFPAGEFIFREARLRDLDLDDSRKRGHVDVHLEFLHFSNRPPPTAAFPACAKLGKL